MQNMQYDFFAGSCIEKTSSKSVNLRQPGHEAQTWMFDHVAGDDTSQEEMFRGKPYQSAASICTGKGFNQQVRN